jgi:hypothetical protein
LYCFFFQLFLQWYHPITKELLQMLPGHSCLCTEEECLPCVLRVPSRRQQKQAAHLAKLQKQSLDHPARVAAERRLNIKAAIEANKAAKAKAKGKKARKPQTAKVKAPKAKQSPQPQQQQSKRFRHSPARCKHGKQMLSAEELKAFGWLKHFISVLPLKSAGQQQQQQLDELLEELAIAAGAAQKQQQVFVARNVAITPNNALRADLQEMMHRYRAFYNALVSLFNSDTATFKVLSDVSRADGAGAMLRRLQQVADAECTDLERQTQLLFNLQQRLEVITSTVPFFFLSSFG